VEHFRAARIPEYRFPERAASALAVLAQRAEFLKRPDQPDDRLGGINLEAARKAIQPCLGSGKPLPPEVLHAVLEAYGIPGIPMRLARTADEAMQAAEALGYPVALKVASAEIPHKSDAGGVLLDLQNAQVVAEGYLAVMDNCRKAHPGAHIEGISVQRMLPDGQDVIVGAVQDPQFGALVMFGSGGVEVEGLRDVAFALAPCTHEEAEYLLDSTWAGRKLGGYRGYPPADREAVLEAVLRLSQLAADLPEIQEIEMNPLRALGQGQGAYALDARARLGSP
jgi:acetyltransferase